MQRYRLGAPADGTILPHASTQRKGKASSTTSKKLVDAISLYILSWKKRRRHLSYSSIHSAPKKVHKLKLKAFLSVLAIFFIAALAIFALLSRYPCLYLCSSNVYDEPKPLPERPYQERVTFIEEEIQKNRKYVPLESRNPEGYNVFDCPLEPPLNYPQEFPILDVLNHWPIADTDTSKKLRYIHQGLCIFDVSRHGTQKVRQLIQAYQQAEKPFVVKNDPHALKTAERWNTDNYLHNKLQRKVFQGEFSNSLSMMYWKMSRNHVIPNDFQAPTQKRPTTFERWFKRAESMEPNGEKGLRGDEENSYLRIDGCLSPTAKCHATHRTWGALSHPFYYFTHLDDGDFLHDDLPFFSPRYYDQGISKDYLIEPEKSRGIQCRFGAKGLIAEDHFDNERNFITVLSGERRYILGHPNNCRDMSLYPMAHPLERHSQVNWTNPDLSNFPNFEKVHVNEVVLQAGDILYLPTYWFHHIVSLNLNYQCNTRSGHSLDYDQDIFDCGFLYPWPS